MALESTPTVEGESDEKYIASCLEDFRNEMGEIVKSRENGETVKVEDVVSTFGVAKSLADDLGFVQSEDEDATEKRREMVNEINDKLLKMIEEGIESGDIESSLAKVGNYLVEEYKKIRGKE